MPRIRRREKQRSAWTNAHREHLISGLDFFGSGFNGAPCLGEGINFDRTTAAACWEDLRDELQAAALYQYGPGHRAWAWWQFESAAPRDKSRTEPEQLYDAGLLVGDELRTVETMLNDPLRFYLNNATADEQAKLERFKQPARPHPMHESVALHRWAETLDDADTFEPLTVPCGDWSDGDVLYAFSELRVEQSVPVIAVICALVAIEILRRGLKFGYWVDAEPRLIASAWSGRFIRAGLLDADEAERLELVGDCDE